MLSLRDTLLAKLDGSVDIILTHELFAHRQFFGHIRSISRIQRPPRQKRMNLPIMQGTYVGILFKGIQLSLSWKKKMIFWQKKNGERKMKNDERQREGLEITVHCMGCLSLSLLHA